MSRPVILRKVCSPPKMIGFKPFGLACKNGKVTIKFEEYESIKLVDYDLLSQDEAADMMGVSRPTFTRIYNRALKTIAKAFVECKSIEIEGGSYQFEHDWYRCRKCYKLIQGIENHSQCNQCSNFGSNELINLNVNSNK